MVYYSSTAILLPVLQHIKRGKAVAGPSELARQEAETADPMDIARAAGAEETKETDKLWKAPKPRKGEHYSAYLERVVQSLENFVNHSTKMRLRF